MCPDTSVTHVPGLDRGGSVSERRVGQFQSGRNMRPGDRDWQPGLTVVAIDAEQPSCTSTCRQQETETEIVT
jgi:hypothetical protein